jgi:hypothetical protein
MYKLPQAVYDEIMAPTTSLAAGLKLLSKEYRVLEDLRKSQAKSRAKTLSEVAHQERPCPHCLTPQRRAARFSELVRIVSELEVTADGVPITPKTELWQAHPQRGKWGELAAHICPWPCGPTWRSCRDPGLPVYSTEEAARKAELSETN